MTTTKTPCDLLITAAWLLPVAPVNESLENHAIAITDGAITAIGPNTKLQADYLPAETLNLDHHIVMPGLINAHGHAAMSLLRGAGEDQPLEIVWDGQILDFDLFVVPKGAPNKDAAMKFIAFSTDTQRLADQASWISYGPARKSSGDLVGLYSDGKTEMAPHMPTAAKNLENALVNNFEFWVDMDAELNERFNAWLAQ